MRRLGVISVALGIVAVTLALAAAPAQAVPAYSRRYGVDCSSCHTTWGALNTGGLTFRLSGYRRMNGVDLEPVVKDLPLAGGDRVALPATFPASIVMGVGFDYTSEQRRSFDGTHTDRTGSSLNLEDISIFVTSPLGRHISVFSEFPMYETKFGEFTPTGPAEARDTSTRGQIQLQSENPTFEVAKIWFNNLLPSEWVPQDSVNILAGITHPPLAYAPGKVRLSVNQYLVYERRALDLISPNKVTDVLTGDEADRLFRLSEPQVLVELNGMLVPFGKPTDLGPPDTLWIEYHLGFTNGSNSKSDGNTQKGVYGRFVTRWWGQSLGAFGYFDSDTYDDFMRRDGSIGGNSAGLGIMSGRQLSNRLVKVGPDMTLSLMPWGIPLSLENQALYSRESDPTGFKKGFSWWGGFSQLNWRVFKPLIAYGRFDWIKGNGIDDTAVGGITRAKPREWDAVVGAQYMIWENFKVVTEWQKRDFENTFGNHEHVRGNTWTMRASLGF